MVENIPVFTRQSKAPVIAGVLILVGAIAAFAYTTSAAMAEATGSFNYSINVWAEYGMGLEALFGFLMIIVGARTKPEAA